MVKLNNPEVQKYFSNKFNQATQHEKWNLLPYMIQLGRTEAIKFYVLHWEDIEDSYTVFRGQYDKNFTEISAIPHLLKLYELACNNKNDGEISKQISMNILKNIALYDTNFQSLSGN